MNPELIPINDVLYTVQVYDEMYHLQDPLYRERRMVSINNGNMAKHRSYLTKILPRHTDIDDIQVWMIHCLASLYRRLDESHIGNGPKTRIKAEAFPDHIDSELQTYRENLLKLLT